MQRIALIGVGTMGGAHAQAYTSIPSAKVVGVISEHMGTAQAVASATGATAFPNWDTMMQQIGDQIDIVDVCVPTPFHKEYVLKAAAAGKHVFCEKPLARTFQDGQEMIAACERAGVRFFVGHVVRFFPEFVLMRDQVQSGAIGNVAVVRTSRGGTFPRGRHDWYANFAWSGGVALDLSIHDFDWLRWVFGPVERVTGRTLVTRRVGDQGPMMMDYGLFTMRFKSGVISHTEGTWAKTGGFGVDVEIAGDSGLLRYDGTANPVVTVQTRASGGGGGGVAVPESPLFPHENPYRRELEHFIDCIENGTTPIVTANDALEAVRISIAMLESSRRREPVTLDEIK
jgi:predicted dehydrogenase